MTDSLLTLWNQMIIDINVKLEMPLNIENIETKQNQI